MFLGKNLFREYYSLGIKFREQVFLGIFFEGVFLPLAQNSGVFFSYRGKKKIAPLRDRAKLPPFDIYTQKLHIINQLP